MGTVYEQLPSQAQYNNFILDISPETVRVSLPTVMEFEGKQNRVSKILGLTAHKLVNLRIVDVFSRSIKYKLTWDETKTEEILVFCPVSKSPEEFLRDLDHKVTLKVASTYTDEELKDLEKQAKKKFGKSMKEAIAKGNIKIEKL